uniref:J domain-containing protein n=1 Tax=Aegilops tauschii subsp. strangulata TaxID=200361 RepID=A0A453HA14_AEGTS
MSLAYTSTKIDHLAISLLYCQNYIGSVLNKVQTTSSWRKTSKSSTGGTFSDDARRRYYQRMQQEFEDEQERVQRIRHMQSVFNRERNKFRKSYESWKENGPPGGYNYIPRDDWYWQSDTPNSENKNRRTYTPAGPRGYPMSHHYTVLGLDRSRGTPYTDAEVKNAFRTKAMEVHPDQNQDNRETAEEEFKEVVKSYEAIKLERKNNAS